MKRSFFKFVMKHGIGGPGSIAKAMAKSYRRHLIDPDLYLGDCEEQVLLAMVYLSRVNAAYRFGKAQEYGYSDVKHHIIDVVSQNPDLPSLICHVIVSEHPELIGPELPEYKWDILEEVIEEIIAKVIPEWKQRQNCARRQEDCL